MHILHVINSICQGGAESLLVNFLTHLSQNKNITIELLSLTKKDIQTVYVKKLEDAGIRVTYLTNHSHVYDLRIPIKLYHLIKDRKFDVVHFHLFPTNYYASLLPKISTTKFVFTEHSTSNSRRKIPLLKHLESALYSRFDKIVAINDVVSSSLVNWIPSIKQKITIIHNGFDIKSIAEAKPIENFRQEFNFKSSDILILKAASFNKYKNHKLVFDAMCSLPAHYKLLLAGIGPFETDYRKYVKEIGIENQVFFLGYRHDIFSLLKTVDLIILSSYFEGLSGVTIESIASNTAFIASNVIGIKELIKDKRCLFNNNDVEEVADCIKTFCENEQIRKESTEANKAILGDYTLDSMTRNHLELYESLNG